MLEGGVPQIEMDPFYQHVGTKGHFFPIEAEQGGIVAYAFQGRGLGYFQVPAQVANQAEFAQLLRNGVKILQPALGRSGGIWETKKIAAIAETHNAEMAPHLYAGPVEWAANIHLAASIPNLLMAETIQTGGAFHLALIKQSITWEDGFIRAPTAPGLGIDFDEDLARAHPYSGDNLHLEMQEAPCDYVNENRFEGGAPASKE